MSHRIKSSNIKVKTLNSSLLLHKNKLNKHLNLAVCLVQINWGFFSDCSEIIWIAMTFIQF